MIDIARAGDDKQVQRAAVRALAQSTNARARAEVRTLVENNTVDEALRTSVIDGIDRDHVTAEDAAWLRGLYAKTTSARIKERIASPYRAREATPTISGCSRSCATRMSRSMSAVPRSSASGARWTWLP